jgi:hypothetical protein
MGKLSTSSCKGLWKGGFGIMMRKVVEKKILWSEKGVKQGHFVVIATKGWKTERFSIELNVLGGYTHF